MRVAILRGGPSSEYESSLVTGALVREALSDVHQISDVLIDREGTWHKAGLPITQYKALEQADLVWNALHGEYGEDGQVQQLLEQYGVPYTGPRPFAAASAWQKSVSLDMLEAAGLQVPETLMIEAYHENDFVEQRLFKELGSQYLLKPLGESSSRGVRVVRAHQHLGPVLARLRPRHESLLAQEALHGREFKVVVIDGFRGVPDYVLIPVEILKSSPLTIFNPHQDDWEYQVPPRLGAGEKEQLMQTALQAHRALHMSHYSSVDMILTRRGLFVIEVDSLPPLKEGDYFSRALKSVGSSFREFIQHVTHQAVR